MSTTDNAGGNNTAPAPSNSRQLGVETHSSSDGATSSDFLRDKSIPEAAPVAEPVKAETKEAPVVEATAEADKSPTQDQTEGDAPADADPTQLQGYSRWEKEYQTTGKLSEETYAEIAEKIGAPKEYVDDFIAARQNAVAALDAEFLQTMGGTTEQQTKIVEWARSTYSQAKKDTINGLIDSRNVESQRLAVQMMVNDYKASGGTFEPSKVVGQGGESRQSAQSSGFASDADYRDAIRSPRYKKDPTFQREVMNRLKASPWFRNAK